MSRHYVGPASPLDYDEIIAISEDPNAIVAPGRLLTAGEEARCDEFADLVFYQCSLQEQALLSAAYRLTLWQGPWVECPKMNRPGYSPVYLLT